MSIFSGTAQNGHVDCWKTIKFNILLWNGNKVNSDKRTAWPGAPQKS